MHDSIWIAVPDAASAAFLSRDAVGILETRLVQCHRGWRVVVRPDREPGILYREIVTLVQAWLRANRIGDVVLHINDRDTTIRRE